MHRLCTRCLAIALVLSGTKLAAARCTVALEGAAEVTEPIRLELDSFEDDGTACVSVWVACRTEGDQVAIELRDELGGVAQRSFTSPAGAAAFVISWTRRPLPARDVVVRTPPPASPPPSLTRVSPPVASARWPDEPWHLELAAGLVVVDDDQQTYGTIGAAVVRQIRWFRFTAGVRVVYDTSDYYTDEGVITVGVAEQLSDHVGLRVELLGAHVLWESDPSYRTTVWAQNGVRGGARVTVSWHITPAFALDLGAGGDVLSPMYSFYGEHETFGTGEYSGFPYADVTARWSL